MKFNTLRAKKAQRAIIIELSITVIETSFVKRLFLMNISPIPIAVSREIRRRSTNIFIVELKYRWRRALDVKKNTINFIPS
ncbi:MAG: hypothetical protein WCO33_03600 [bacterium]